MTPMTCWSTLITGLYRDYRELFTESGPFSFVAQVSCVYSECINQEKVSLSVFYS